MKPATEDDSRIPTRHIEKVSTALAARHVLVLCLAALLSVAAVADEPSGAYYDWEQTMEPERPWLLPYHQTVVTKIFLCSRNGDGEVEKVFLTFEDALEVIRKLDNLTCGIPKIVYLVGWQYNGHDSKYPSWAAVNEHLKRPQDATAVDSLRWLIREGRNHHTIVSLHTNMFDAYEDSPLWDEYVERNVIAKDTDGQVIFGEVHSGMRSSQISYTQEWKLGLAQKRIDGLLELLPELKEGKTIHIDAFHSCRPLGRDEPISPYLGYTMDQEAATQRKIYRYWRNQGLDVTSEGAAFLRPDPFIGLQPMAWADDPAIRRLPDKLYCTTPMRAEQEIRKDPNNLTGLLEQFCMSAVPVSYTHLTLPTSDLV